MDSFEKLVWVLIIAFICGVVVYGIYLACLRARYAKKLHSELENLSNSELEDMVQRTGYLLKNHGDLLSISSELYYQMRYTMAKKKLGEKQVKV